MTTATKTNTNQLESALRFQNMSLDELRVEAERLGVVLQTTDHGEIIDQLIAASVERPEKAEAGILISLHSRDAEAKETILKARNVIVQNEQAGKSFSMFLKNQEGSFYTQRAAGCRISNERLNDVLRIVSPLPDGSQDATLKQLRAAPESFEDPVLVRLRRRNQDGTYSSYVMLYLKKRQKLAEQNF